MLVAKLTQCQIIQQRYFNYSHSQSNHQCGDSCGMSHTGCIYFFIHALSPHTHTSDDITSLCVVRDRRRTGDQIGHSNNTSMERSAENQYKYLWISLLYLHRDRSEVCNCSSGSILRLLKVYSETKMWENYWRADWHRAHRVTFKFACLFFGAITQQHILSLSHLGKSISNTEPTHELSIYDVN